MLFNLFGCANGLEKRWLDIKSNPKTVCQLQNVFARDKTAATTNGKLGSLYSTPIFGWTTPNYLVLILVSTKDHESIIVIISMHFRAQLKNCIMLSKWNQVLILFSLPGADSLELLTYKF